ncbi:MAG TPA: DUF4242 domain-containing protein [Longimicrobiales bacterium]|nr:DUF4242 domain-containing protein [Longimicrobiales bacterium]
MAYVIVERIFEPPLTEAEQLARMSRLGPCLGLHGVRWIRSYVSKDRRHGVCEYEAPDAEAVRVAHRTANVPFERVWVGDVFSGETGS